MTPPKITLSTSSLEEFIKQVNALLEAHPHVAGKVRDLVYASESPAAAFVAQMTWPDLDVRVSPTIELVAAIRRCVGRDIARTLGPPLDGGYVVGRSIEWIETHAHDQKRPNEVRESVGLPPLPVSGE